MFKVARTTAAIVHACLFCRPDLRTANEQELVTILRERSAAEMFGKIMISRRRHVDYGGSSPSSD